MSECHLLCNIVKCRKELKSQGWVTICSHIFCMDHGQNAADNEKCLVCETTFCGKFDIVVMDLNPSEQYKTMILAGLSPEKILDIVNKSLTFWTYQIYQDRLFRDSQVRAAKQHSADVADYCESVIVKHKIEVQKLSREIQDCQKEMEEKVKQIKDLMTQLHEKSKLIKNLQCQNDSLKRNLASYLQSHENYNRKNDQVESDSMRSRNSNYSYTSQNYEGKKSHGISNPENQHDDFVFKPMTSPSYPNRSNYQFK